MPKINPRLGYPVTTRQFSLEEMVAREWGSEFRAPDHGIYQFSNARRFDSTDTQTTGIYSKGVFTLSLDENGGVITDEGRNYVYSEP